MEPKAAADLQLNEMCQLVESICEQNVANV